MASDSRDSRYAVTIQAVYAIRNLQGVELQEAPRCAFLEKPRGLSSFDVEV